MEASVDFKIVNNLTRFATSSSCKYHQSGENSMIKLFQRCEIVVAFTRLFEVGSVTMMMIYIMID